MGRAAVSAVPSLSPLSVMPDLASGDVLPPLLASSGPVLVGATSPPAVAPLALLASHPPQLAPAAARTACSLSCSTWAMAACMARPASWRCWLSSLPRAKAAAQEELAGMPAALPALAAWCAERQLAATSPAS